MNNNSDIVTRLGKQIQRIRKEKKLTLAQLAEKSGVSRSMLSQVERGQANPTFGTLWNLSGALGLEMSELVEQFESDGTGVGKIEHLTAEDTPQISNAKDGYTLSLLAPHDQIGRFEWYTLEIRSGGALKSEPHSQGCQEHLTILEGAAEVVSGEQTVVLNRGDTGRYKADVSHTIRNISSDRLQALLIVIG